MNGWLQFLAAVLAVIGSVFTTWLVVRQTGKKTRVDTTQQLIDQLQEERTASDARHAAELAAVEARHQGEITLLRSEVADVRSRMDGMEDRELTHLDYEATLRHHIDQRLGPPPPAWPEALLRRRRA